MLDGPEIEASYPAQDAVSVWRDVSILTVICLLTLFVGLGEPHLWDRDEPRNAGCAVEMLERSDWVTPMFNDELRSHKPVLLYWFMMFAYSVFGVNELAARLPSAILALGTVLLTYSIGRRLFDAKAALYAGIALATCLMFVVAGRAATPDSVLMFFSTLGLAVFVYSGFNRRGHCGLRQSNEQSDVGEISFWTAVGLYSVLALAVLAKGPIGVVLPCAVIGMYLLLFRQRPRTEGTPQAFKNESRLPFGRSIINFVKVALAPFAPLHFFKTCLAMRLHLAIGLILLIAGPWYVWVGIRTNGDWLNGFFLEHNFGRAMQSMEGHGGGFWYYPLAILVGTFPWSILAGAVMIDTVRRLRRNADHYWGTVFCVCWVLVYVGLFSVARTKLPSYITPCYPGVALLVGAFLRRWVRGDHLVANIWPKLSLGTLGIVGLAIAAGLPFLAQRYLPGDEWIGVIGLLLVATALLGAFALSRDNRSFVANSLIVNAVLFSAFAFGVIAGRVDRHQSSSALITLIDRRTDDARIGAFGVLEPSWVFYHRKPVFGLTRGTQAAEPRVHDWNPRELEGVRRFLMHDRSHFVITTDRCFHEIESDLPAGVEVLHEVPYFLKKDKLLILGWQTHEGHLAAVTTGVQSR